MVHQPIEFKEVRTYHLTTVGGVELWIKRDDELHPQVSGNKLYKLKYNVSEARALGHTSILTFGGAYSNHLAATAAYCKAAGIQSIGIVRGDQVTNPTLATAKSNGMLLHFITRSAYRQKEEEAMLDALRHQFNHPFIIPEGGANEAGVLGAAEMLSSAHDSCTHIALAVGTGTTLLGLAKRGTGNQKMIGIPVHRDATVVERFAKQLGLSDEVLHRIELSNEYHFGGYARWNEALLNQIRTLQKAFDVPLDPIYTGKAFYGVFDMIQRGRFAKGSKVLFIHTGGLQGIAGFEERFSLRLTT
jgi:1-aminocyclopropane-1-carboxylate deaminase